MCYNISPYLKASISFLSILLSFACAEVSGLEDRMATNKIIGGYTDPAPSYMTSIRIQGQHVCGGSLIKDNWVLTAAHCVDFAPKEDFSVCVGKSKLSDCQDADFIRINEIRLHKDWQGDDLGNGFDIALLKLERSLPNQVSQLASSSAEPPLGALANARGWGVTGYDNGTRILPNEMQRVKLPYYGSRICTEQLGFTERETIICLEKIGNIDDDVAEKGTCNGDSGSPIHYQGKQIGIVSFGYQRDGQCLGGIFGGYTRVSSYLRWIEQNISQSEGRDAGAINSRFVTGSLVSLKTSKGQYVVALNGGGGDVNSTRNQRGAWETFEVVEQGGDYVALRTNDGSFLSAEAGGGGGLFANRRLIGGWEIFKVIHRGGDRFALQASSGHYFVAEDGGNQDVNANRESVGAWEEFSIELH